MIDMVCMIDAECMIDALCMITAKGGALSMTGGA
jgi:hypothetical protein